METDHSNVDVEDIVGAYGEIGGQGEGEGRIDVLDALDDYEEDE